ncbi:Protein SHOOT GRAVITROPISM 5 [Hibiscus syriacus]|uniref:Protein SHOOT GRAVITROPISM 5 n=1 Tax=Hibiscus syriacus TaxID=106335 RepID=A0A6A2Y583_HIBSY|nr:Protein SHOOT GRAVITROPISM 5 [Hibiscus syriacus]
MLPNSSSSCLDNGTGNINKRKRRPAGTPDPDAEVVSLSPKTLLESDRYVCEICNQGFQRDQNLQMHRRRHKVPWKLLKRTPVLRKRVFVCPEPSCLHHDPCHALGDMVGIKKHFRRKHSNHKQWVCDKCSKGYAVQSDYKAHLKTCGTRGHSCDCGRVFSRVESFIEHQDACHMGRVIRPESQAVQLASLSRTASSPTPSTDTHFSTAPMA